MNELRPTGEDVKAKKEKLLTCVCTRARWPQVVKKNKRSFDRERGTVGEKARDVFDRWAEGSGTVFDEAEYTGACCAIALCEGRTLRRK